MTESEARVVILRQQRNGLMNQLETASLVAMQLRERIAQLEAEIEKLKKDALAANGPGEA